MTTSFSAALRHKIIDAVHRSTKGLLPNDLCAALGGVYDTTTVRHCMEAMLDEGELYADDQLALRVRRPQLRPARDMTALELIRVLVDLVDEYGNLPVYVMGRGGGEVCEAETEIITEDGCWVDRNEDYNEVVEPPFIMLF